MFQNTLESGLNLNLNWLWNN